jgi:ribosomal protein L3 glutamine methyltransferase
MQNEHSDTVGALIEWCAGELEAGGVFCGHGTASTLDESASLVYHIVGLEHDVANHNARAAQYALPIDAEQFDRVRALLRRRIERRIPTPYLLNEAWFAGLKFYVDERVLIPRSPFAELVAARFQPWLGSARVERILDIGTGSACIAIACASAFPDSMVVATDVSAGALEVAAINVVRHGLEDRISLQQADVFDGVSGRFDLIVSNPPYVPEAEMATLPPEYRHEPDIGLASGPDGLASVRRILQDAAGYLEADGTLAVEVGAGGPNLEVAFPHMPFVWPELAMGGEGIALIRAADLVVDRSGKIS